MNYKENMLKTCKKYIGMGLKLVPAPYKTKGALLEEWTKNPYTEYSQVEHLADVREFFNIGILTGEESNLLVIDIDINKKDKEGKLVDGLETIKKLEELYGKLPITVTAKTGSGGQHMYFKIPRETAIKSKADYFGDAFKGVDVKCNGGKVMAPPSMHECGNQYKWLEGHSIFELEIAELPKNWYDTMVEISNTKKENTNNNTTADGIGIITKGERNERLYKMACSLLRTAQSIDELFAMISAINKTKCQEPLEEDEIKRIVESAWKNKDKNQKEVMQQRTIEIFSASELLNTVLPPINWIIPNFLGEGLNILAGDPKTGKSWFALNLALAVSRGTPFLGMPIPNDKRVLYLTLEDSKQRLQGRLEMLGAVVENTGNLYMCLDVGQMDEGGLEIIENNIKEKNIELVIIDTWIKFKGVMKTGSNNAYEKDYGTLTPIKALADKYHIAVLLIHHLKKGREDNIYLEMSGSAGYAGASDSMYILEKHDEFVKKLTFTGRDIIEDEMYLTMDENCVYHNDNIVPEPSVFDTLSPEARQVAQIFKDNTGIQYNCKQIATMVHKAENSVRQHLSRLYKDGFLNKVKTGIYEYNPDNFYEHQINGAKEN